MFVNERPIPRNGKWILLHMASISIQVQLSMSPSAQCCQVASLRGGTITVNKKWWWLHSCSRNIVTCHVLQRHNIFCVTCTNTTYKTDINSKMHFSHTIQCFQLLLKLSSEIGNTLLYLYFTWSIVHPAPKTQICHWIAPNRVDNADIYFHFKWPVTIHWDCFVSPLLMISCCKYSIN